MQSVAAAVTLYNPQEAVVKNIMSYLDQVDRVYIVDNSETPNDIVVSQLINRSKIWYYSEGINSGVATALNIAAQQAIKDGFSYLLTMDQDSSAANNLIQKLYKIMVSDENIGLVTAEHFDPDIHDHTKQIVTQDILFTMTSGNLLRLSAFQAVGNFVDKLFIDHLDHEFCLRLKKNKFRILKTNETYIYHKLGAAVKKKLFGLTFCPTNHPPVRLYYRTRNRFYVNQLYRETFPEYVKIDIRNMIRELIEIYFFEKKLWVKTKMIFRGFRDYKKNIFGKFS